MTILKFIIYLILFLGALVLLGTIAFFLYFFIPLYLFLLITVVFVIGAIALTIKRYRRQK